MKQARHALTGDTRKIFDSKTVDESHSARVLIGCKPISHAVRVEYTWLCEHRAIMQSKNNSFIIYVT